MKQKGIRHAVCAALTLLLSLQMVFSFNPMEKETVYAASAKVAFVPSIAKTVLDQAKKAGSTGKTISVVKVSKYTNVFSGRGTGSLKGRLYRGSAVYVIRTKGSYSYISSGSLKGWVKSSVLLTGSKAKAYVKSIVPRVGTVKTAQAIVRSKPASKAEEIAVLTKGTQLIVTKASAHWLVVRLNGKKTGYVARKDMKTENGLFTGMTKAQEKTIESMIAAAKKDSENNVNADLETPAEAETTPAAAETTPAAQENQGTSADFLEGEVPAATAEAEEGTWVSLGEFKLTAYCPGTCCNGQWAGQTATGNPMTANHTIAVDRKVIPLRSKIKIEGFDTVFVADDTGVIGNQIDIFFATHAETEVWGVQYRNVYILKE